MDGSSLLIVRGIVSVVIGIVAFVFPGLAIAALVVIFGIRALAEALMAEDKVGMFAYTDSVRTLADSPRAPTSLDAVAAGIPAPGCLEAKLFDALETTLDRVRTVEGGRAVLLISSGIDTFSRTTFDQVRASAQRFGVPIYCVGLSGLVERSTAGATGPSAMINWPRAKERLKTLARSADAASLANADEPTGFDDGGA